MNIDPFSLAKESRFSIYVSRIVIFLEIYLDVIFHRPFKILNACVKYRYGFVSHSNLGDDLNVTFIGRITKEHLFPMPQYISGRGFCDVSKNNVYYCIGSCLHLVKEHNAIIWGSGLLTEDFIPSVSSCTICAVRGPETRRVLLSKGFACPEIYGDPALLLPFYYRPLKMGKKFKLGIIPHYVDMNREELEHFRSDSSVVIIKMSGYNNWKEVIDQICSCECIVSSSLHGLILSEAYHIPSKWVEVKEPIVGEFKRRFKFYDFYSSMGFIPLPPHTITINTKVDELVELVRQEYVPKFISVKPLVEVCPFSLKKPKYPFI